MRALGTRVQKEPGFWVPQKEPGFWALKRDPDFGPQKGTLPQLWTYQAPSNPGFFEFFCTNLTNRVSTPHLHGLFQKTHSH